MKLFVSGIGTGVGKTIASAILTEALQADYWKPVQAGDLHQSDRMKVKALVSNAKSVFHPEAFQLNTPASPHYAAQIDGLTITADQLPFPKTENHLIIEGAGGLFVPISMDLLFIDWIKQLEVPVVLVSRHYLGSINHTLSSIEALKARQIPIAGVLFMGDEKLSTEEAILHFGKVKCLGRVNEEQEFTTEVVKKYAAQLALILKEELGL